MFCQYCGKEIQEEDCFCSHCGGKTGIRVVVKDLSSFFVPNNTNALIAYYFGIASLLCGLIFGIPAIIFGILGLLHEKKYPEARGGYHAWTGIILGFITFALIVMIGIILTFRK